VDDNELYQLVSMPDEERERLIGDFWNEVGEGLDVAPGFVERLRTMRPRLPDPPPPNSKPGSSRPTWYRARSSVARSALTSGERGRRGRRRRAVHG
jgi:hypothetical protein